MDKKMVTAEAIAKEVLFPYLEKDPGFLKEPEGMWNILLKGLAGYEQDPKPLFAAIYRLQLYDPERIIQRLPVIYDRFLEGLAEQYVLGNGKVISQFPWLQKGVFREKVAYFIDLKSAVAKVERENMKRDLPLAFDALADEITDEELRSVFAKREREDLKAKFKIWDEEMQEDQVKNYFRSVSYNMYELRKSEESTGKEMPVFDEALMDLDEEAKPEVKTEVWPYLVIAIILVGLILWLIFK